MLPTRHIERFSYTKTANSQKTLLLRLFAPLVEVQTSRVGNQVEIRVIDNGSGIKAENLDEVFKPFFTTKPTGAGTGLGLSMSYDIVVKAHNGTMRAESNESGGATFVVTVPA